MAVVSTKSPAILSDEQLLECYARGELGVLEELFERYRSLGYRVAYRLLGNEADALDALQDGFVKALTNLPSFEGRSTFRTWLLRVITNASLDFGRQRGRKETLSIDAVQHEDRDNITPQSFDNPAKDLEREDLRGLLDRALDQLPELQRRTFILHAEAELSYREVADVLQISIGTVMSRLFYARQKLRAILSQWIVK